jgi:xylulokinase
VAHFLGLDSSTQSLTALIVDTDSGQVVADHSVNFGQRLPAYKSPSGFLANPDPQVKHSDPLMWVEALDLALAELVKSGIDLSRVRGVSGAGQQHGSVYLARPIAGLSADKPLVEQVRPLLSRATAPIWMDSSTSVECAEIARAVGGDEQVMALTGSRMIERFTGPQIRKFAKDDPAGWEHTTEVHLVSSFIASLLVGGRAPIDFGDGAGMNLLELAAGNWNSKLLEATAPGLGRKLAPPVASTTKVGAIADYFVKRYGFAAGTPVVAFTGDNPSSLVGMGATRPGTAVISLGTSDTMFAAMAAPRTDPRGFGNVFGNPAGGFMALCCFANGSLAREAVAKQVGLGWDDFARGITEKTHPGNGGNLLLPYFVPEITPRLLSPKPQWFGTDSFVAGKDPAAAARAVVEAQALSMRHHADWIGEKTDTILVTGGASKNQGILRVLADVFQARILPLKVGNSSALGGALRAAQGIGGLGWEQLYRQFAAPDATRAVSPVPAAAAKYEELMAIFETRLAEAVAQSEGKR